MFTPNTNSPRSTSTGGWPARARDGDDGAADGGGRDARDVGISSI